MALAPSALEISLSDEANPRSVFNLVPKVVGERFRLYLKEHGELFNKDEVQLHKYLHKFAQDPNPVDNRLRLKFWIEYERAQMDEASKMNMTSVIGGICTREFFYDSYLTKPERVAWLLCPPTNYMIKVSEALEYAIEEMRDILAIPHITEDVNGKKRVNTALMANKLKIFELMHNIVKGVPVQRNMNLNVTTTDPSLMPPSPVSMEELEKQLSELRQRDESSRNVVVTTGVAGEVLPD